MSYSNVGYLEFCTILVRFFVANGLTTQVYKVEKTVVIFVINIHYTRALIEK